MDMLNDERSFDVGSGGKTTGGRMEHQDSTCGKRRKKKVEDNGTVPSSWTCAKCGKAFSTKQSLTTHIRTAKSCFENDRKQKIFQCQYCQKTLSSKQMLLYHDGICHLKTQHVYERKLEHLESLLANSLSTEESTNETNVLIGCHLMSSDARVPVKRTPLEFHLFPSIGEGMMDIPPLSRVEMSLGISFRIPMGWCGVLTLVSDMTSKGIVGDTMMMDGHGGMTDELRVCLYNSTSSTCRLESSSVIASVRFFRCTHHFNIHMNCLRV